MNRCFWPYDKRHGLPVFLGHLIWMIIVAVPVAGGFSWIGRIYSGWHNVDEDQIAFTILFLVAVATLTLIGLAILILLTLGSVICIGKYFRRST